jgi:hypothetical protein
MATPASSIRPIDDCRLRRILSRFFLTGPGIGGENPLSERRWAGEVRPIVRWLPRRERQSVLSCGRIRAEGAKEECEMKTIRLLGGAVCALALALNGVAAADTYGNTDPFETQSSHSPNYVLGVQVLIPVDFQLQSFGMMYGHEDYGAPLVSNAIFGLYSSGGDGLPEYLMAVTDEINLSAQQTYDNIAFTTTPDIPAGTYWMMALYESLANPRMSLLDQSSLVAYWSNPYANGMPDAAPGITTYTGQNFNYWVNGVPAPGALAAFGLLGLFGARRRRSA